MWNLSWHCFPQFIILWEIPKFFLDLSDIWKACHWHPSKWHWPLYKWKKIDQIIGFMVFKSTSSYSRSQRKNRFWKICTESQDITKKVSKIGLPNQTSKIWHILANILGLGAYFLKPIFTLKLSVRAGRFEYQEPRRLQKNKSESHYRSERNQFICKYEQVSNNKCFWVSFK